MTRTGWGLLVLLATGCGSFAAIDGGEDAPATDLPSSDPVDVEVVGDALCSAQPADAPLMVRLSPAGSWLLRNDGLRRSLDLGFGQLDPSANHQATGITRGDHLATFASSWAANGSVEVATVVTMFDDEGELLWRLHADDHDASGIAIDDSGRLLMGRYFYTVSPADQVVVEDGVVQTLPAGVTEARSWASDGVLRASVGGVPGFYDVTTDVAAPIAWAGEALHTRPWSTGYVSLLAGKSAPWLGLSRLDDSEVLVLWDLDEPASQLEVRAVAGDFALLRSGVTERHWRVSLLDGATTEITTVTPTGAPPEEMLYCTPPPMLLDDGRVVLVGGDEALWFHAFDPAADLWATLGEPLREVEMVHAYERGGTFLLEGVVNTYCPTYVGTGDEGLAGASSQIVSPAFGVSRTVEGVWTTIHDSGSCVAFQQDGAQRLWDLATGEEHDLRGTSGAWWNGG